jgi:amino acid transporter
VAILISTLTAVIWYALAMICLFVLRSKEPRIIRPYRTPAYPWLPGFVALLSAFAIYLYARVNVQVLLPTAVLYGAAALWYAFWGRRRVLATAPEEVAARIGRVLLDRERGSAETAVIPSRAHAMEHATGVVLLAGLLSLLWMVARASNLIPGAPTPREVLIVILVWAALFAVVSCFGLFSTRRAPQSKEPSYSHPR